MKGIAVVLAVSALMAGSAFAADKFAVKDSTGNSNIFAVDTTGLATITNIGNPDTNSIIKVVGSDGLDAFTFAPYGTFTISGANAGGANLGQFQLQVYSANPAQRPNMSVVRGRGLKNAPQAVQVDDKLGTFGFSGIDATSPTPVIQTPALLEAFCDGPPTAGGVPGRLSFVTGTNSTTRAERVVVKYDGKVGIGTTAPKTLLHSTGSTILGAAAAANVDADLGNNQCNMWLNEATNAFTIKCKKSDGTVRTGTVTLN